MRRGWVLLAAIGCLMTKPVLAAPNVFGSTGLLLTPTADVLNQGEWNVHAHFINRDDLSTWGGNYAPFQNLEVGLTGVHFQGGGTRGIINGKYRLVPEKLNMPALAIGVVDASERLNNDATIYGVVSKTFGTDMAHPIRLHLGYGNGIYDKNVIGGADFLLNPRVLLMGEYDGDKVNFGVRAGLTPEIRVELGSYDSDFGGGISYRARF
jgi:hypothetical protein